MQNFKSYLLAVSSLLLAAAPGAYAQNLTQSVFVERREIVFPIPADNDVIKTLGKPSSKELPAKRIKFLVWNLHKGTEETFRIEYTGLGYDRDIIMNQEIFLDSNMTDVWRYMPQFQFTTATSFFSGKEKTRTGVANASTVAPVHSDYLRTFTLEPVIHSPKVLLITSYPIKNSDKKLTVVNIHGINFVSNKSFLLEMNRIYDKIKDIPSPLVFAGDFNTWNQERIDLLNQYAKKLGLDEAKFFPDNRMSFNGYPLDHFLHTTDLKVIDAKVDGIYTGSDHKPLQVEVEFTDQDSTSSSSSSL